MDKDRLQDAGAWQQAAERRRQRYSLRHLVWKVSNLRRLRTCGRGVRDETVTIKRAVQDDGSTRAAAEGLVTCASIWACPVCSVHIRVARSLDLAAAVEAHRARGGALLFVTLTLRHTREDGLADLLGLLYGSWRAVQQRRDWRAPGGPESAPGIKAQLGIIGWVRAAEITYGANGWHPHLHVLLFLDRASRGMRDRLHCWLEGAWLGTVRRGGGDGLEGVAVDVRRVEDTDESLRAMTGYVAKSETAHLEVTRGDAKRPRGSESWAAWDLLDAAGDGEAWAVRRWWEYERATSGRRAIEWSRGLRDLLELEPEKSDEDIVSDTDDGETVAVLTSAEWHLVTSQRFDWLLLEAAAVDGADGVVSALRRARFYRDTGPPRAA